MTTAYISKADNLNVKILFDDPQAGEALSQFFAFQTENVKFNPKYKNTAWDGFIRPYKARSGLLPFGLLEEAVEWITGNGIRSEICPEFLHEFNTKPTPDEIKDWVLPNQEKMDSVYRLRPYQESAVLRALFMRRAIIESPTGSGKTFISFWMIMYMVMVHKLRVLMVTPRTSLVTQAIREFTTKYGGNPDLFYGIYEGAEKETDKPVVIATRDSAATMLQYITRGKSKSLSVENSTWFHQFGALIVDEAHEAEAKTYSAISDCCINTTYRFGLSGSFYRPKMEMRILTGMFGPKFVTRRTRELIEDNTLAKMNINVLLLRYPERDRMFVKQSKLKYPGEMEFINTHKKRTNFAAGLCLSREGNVLCLYRNIEHGKAMFEEIKRLVNEHGIDRPVYLISGQNSTAQRDAVCEAMENGYGVIALASYGTFSTGIDINRLHHVVLGSPMKSATKVTQSLGRGLRKGNGKESVDIWDIVDDICVETTKGGRALKNPYINYAFKHGQIRMGLYDYEDHPYVIRNVDLETDDEQKT